MLRIGISKSISKLVCNYCGYHPNLISSTIKRTYVSDKIRRFLAAKSIFLDKNIIERQMRPVSTDIQIQSYKGRRHMAGYPVNGQRTRTNAKTKKRLQKLYK